MNIEIDWHNTLLFILGIVAIIFTAPIKIFLVSILPEFLKPADIISDLLLYCMSFVIALIILMILLIIALLILKTIQEILKGNFFFLKITNEKRRIK